MHRQRTSNVMKLFFYGLSAACALYILYVMFFHNNITG